jgi:hypothetical protein
MLTLAREPQASPRERLLRFVVRPARAGALAAGASLLVLASVFVLDSLLPTGLDKLFAWSVGTLFSVVAGVALGFPDSPAGLLAALGRLSGTVVSGGAILTALAPAFFALPSPSNEPGMVVPIFCFGAVLMVLNRWPKTGAPDPDAEIDSALPTSGRLPEAPPREHAEEYALTKRDPAVPAEACEREAACLEVRVLWGGSHLATFHRTPPSAFVVGEGDCDFALPVPTFSLVTRASGFCVTRPAGAGASLTDASGHRRPLEDETGKPSSIELVPGRTVTITLPPPSGARAAYRTSGEGIAPSPIAFSVTLGRAGRRARRWPSLPEARTVVSFVLAAVALTWPIAIGPSREPPTDDLSAEHFFRIQQAIHAADERARGADDNSPPPLASAWRRNNPLYWLDDHGWYTESTETLLALDPEQRAIACASMRAPWGGDSMRHPTAMRLRIGALCAHRGDLRVPAKTGPLVDLPLGDANRPNDLWFEQMNALAPRFGPTFGVWFERLTPKDAAPWFESVDSALVARVPYIRACGALEPVIERATAELRVVVGLDGRIFNVAIHRADGPAFGPSQVTCMARAIDDILTPSKPAKLATLTYRVTILPSSAIEP